MSLLYQERTLTSHVCSMLCIRAIFVLEKYKIDPYFLQTQLLEAILKLSFGKRKILNYKILYRAISFSICRIIFRNIYLLNHIGNFIKSKGITFLLLSQHASIPAEFQNILQKEHWYKTTGKSRTDFYFPLYFMWKMSLCKR